MSDDEARRAAIAAKTIVYETPAMRSVTVSHVTVEEGIALDVYALPDARRELRPAVVFVLGFADARLGARGKDMGAYTSWARLVAAAAGGPRGALGITYTYRDPHRDLRSILAYLREPDTGEALGVDPSRVALWACSGHVPTALATLMDEGPALRCAFLGYGYTLDDARSSYVADAAARFGFAPAPPGKTLDELPPGVPLFLARAGRDEMPGLNAALDRFVEAALARNLPITLVNHPTGPHAFDLFDDTETTRNVIRSVIAFYRSNFDGSGD